MKSPTLNNSSKTDLSPGVLLVAGLIAIGCVLLLVSAVWWGGRFFFGIDRLEKRIEKLEQYHAR